MHTIQEKKDKSIPAIEKVFIKTGEITASRCWDGGGIFEIDIHLPKVDFSKWNKAQSIKCRTSSFHYTDYSPATWNASDKTCTLYIDTSHDTQGSQWTKQQRQGDTFYYLNIEDEKHYPVAGKQLVLLGDATSIGHFCALQQLAAAATKIDGFIVFNNQQTANAFKENCPWLPLQTVLSTTEICHQTEQWIQLQLDKEDYVFYIVGQNQMVVTLRTLLKLHAVNPNQIKSRGFWQ